MIILSFKQLFISNIVLIKNIHINSYAIKKKELIIKIEKPGGDN